MRSNTLNFLPKITIGPKHGFSYSIGNNMLLIFPDHSDILNLPSLQLTSRKPLWLHLQPADIKSRWRHNCKELRNANSEVETTVAEGGQNLTINYTVIDCLQLSDTKTRDDEKMMSFPKSWYTGFSFSVWILKTWQGENDEYRTCGKISAIWWNIKINPQILAYICGYELPTKLQNFMQKDLT